MANFLDSLRQAFYPGYRIPRVDNWDGLKKLPMPRMLQQQLDAARANEVRLQNQLDNRDQTQVLLGTLGRWVAWAGNGTQAASAAG